MKRKFILNFGIGVPVDVIVETTGRFEKLKENKFLIPHQIAKSGDSSMKNIELVQDWMRRARSNLEIAKAGRISEVGVGIICKKSKRWNYF